MKMKIKRYRMDQLEEARKLQESCIKNHLPCPPVSWWQAEIKNIDDKIEEKIECKCNSYTRNGLNIIATAALFLPNDIRTVTAFSDGYISYKDINNTILNVIGWLGYNAANEVTLVLGSSNSPSSIDIYKIEQVLELNHAGVTLKNAVFDNESRKLHSYLQKSFTNDSDSNITIWESGVHFIPKFVGTDLTQNKRMLVVRDVFPEPIILEPGKSLTFTYHFELLYPS